MAKRILLVDDEFLIRKSLIRLFTKLSEETHSNFDFEEACNGFECLTKVYNNYEKGKYFDLLIIDETMPIVKGSTAINFRFS